MAGGIHKKLGPLELWQWLAIGAALGIAYYLYEKHVAGSSTASTTAASTSPTGGDTVPAGSDYGSGGGGSSGSSTGPLATLQSALIDPTTGQPYSTELSTAQAGIQSEITAMESQIASANDGTGAVDTSTTPDVTTSAATAGGASTPGGGLTHADILKESIATQIQQIKAGIIKVTQAGSNAQKIYKAGGVSTAEPTAAAVKKAAAKPAAKPKAKAKK